ncbi:MAG: PQQ-dependent sugar dehydrogenase [Nitriliruptorales bacterium]
MSRRTVVSALALAFVLAACAEDAPPPAASPSPEPDRPSPTAAVPTPEPSPTPTPSPTGPVDVALEPLPFEFDFPMLATAPAGDDRLFVVERRGTVRIVERDGGRPRLVDEPFLDVSNLTRTGGEYGLLGLAFHPDHASNGRFFVHYSDRGDGGARLVEYRVSDDPNRADPDSARQLLAVDQPASNHNGGAVAFGPDGYLFLALGDGGAAADRFGNGQDPSTLLGALLRIDVDRSEGDRPYAIPPDNPFADGDGGAPEVWAYGLRNPFRASFDRDTGDLYIGDVGQNAWEEVDVAPGDAAGLNYGWPITEGTHCFDPPEGCDRGGLTMPVVEYPNGEGGACGVIGGHVYRGSAMPGFAGTYVYGELCAGWVRSFRAEARGDGTFDVGEERELLTGLGGVISFGEDGAGELYVITVDDQVAKLVPAG